jgi:uncharacterized RDD family membrane protein YckC
MTSRTQVERTVSWSAPPALLVVVLACFFLPFLTLSVRGCDASGSGSDTFRHRTVTGTDLVAGRVTAPAAVGFPDAKASMDSLMVRGRRMAVLAVVLTAAGLAVCIGGRRFRRAALWIVSLSTAALSLVPGSLSGGWRGPEPADPRQIQPYETIDAVPAAGWTLAAVASVAAACLIAWLLARPAAVPRPPARSRALAASVDILLVSVAAFIPGQVARVVVRDADISYVLGWLAAGAAYWALFEGLSGHATVGKRCCDLAVIGADGSRVGAARAAVRFAVRAVWGVVFVAAFWFDSFMWPAFCLWLAAAAFALWGPGGRAPHDLLAGTAVTTVRR